MPGSNSIGDEALEHARSQLGQALSDLKSMGAIEDEIMEARPAWIMPFEFVIGQTRGSALDVEFLWVIGGKLPIDCVHSNIAQTARDAARHFSLKWQLDAERLGGAEAARLVSLAEYLYSIVDNDDYWRSSS